MLSNHEPGVLLIRASTILPGFAGVIETRKTLTSGLITSVEPNTGSGVVGIARGEIKVAGMVESLGKGGRDESEREKEGSEAHSDLIDCYEGFSKEVVLLTLL